MMDSKEAKQRMVEGRLYLPFQERFLEKVHCKKNLVFYIIEENQSAKRERLR